MSLVALLIVNNLCAMNREGSMGNNQEVIISRHLRDRDELKSSMFNSGLESGQGEKIANNAQKILEHCKAKGLKKIVIYSSPKKRGVETSVHIKNYIAESDPEIDVQIIEDVSIRDADRTAVNLPEEFKDGETFAPLIKAGDIFYEETFGNNNLLYKFGDPLVDETGQAKYQELVGLFNEYGESYAEFIMRVYDFLGQLRKDLENSKEPFEPVLVFHGATFSIVKDLAEICEQIDNSVFKNVEFGTLVQKAWEYYQKNASLRKDPGFGEMEVVDMTSLLKPEIMEIVSIESDRMRAMLMQQR
jgi:broad specificity phosphatase PhoE